VGPVLLSGIGQVMNKYAQLFDAEYITFNETPKKPYDKTFVFIIPQKESFEYITQKFKPDINDFLNYTIESPHPITEVYSGTKWQHNNLWSEINDICVKLNGDKIQWLKPLT
jgi:hypothetical protein